jgi:hypothetical protein
MTDITPPPELVQKWADQWKALPDADAICLLTYIATQAARWGADQELEACCEYMLHEDFHGFAQELRAARRPKPPSLKEQALDALNLMLMFIPPGDQREQGETIRRALEQLDD